MSDSAFVPAVFQGHIGRRIRYYRQQCELTQTALASRAKINQGYLSEIERGRRKPSASALKVIATALDVPPAVLLGEGNEHDTPRPVETQELPLLVSISAEPPDKPGEQVEMFPVLRHLWAPNRYCLRLTFDSMEPTLKPGDIVLVEYRRNVNPQHVQGKICACLLDGTPTLKRVLVERKDGQLVIVLRGDNPDVPPVAIDKSSEFSIQGVVTHLISRSL